MALRGLTDDEREQKKAKSLGISNGSKNTVGAWNNKIAHLGTTANDGAAGSYGTAEGQNKSSYSALNGLGSLGGSSYYSNVSSLSPGTTSTGSSGSNVNIKSNFKYDKYSPSEAVLAAQRRLEELQRPDDYQSKWSDQLQSSLDAILNRKDFQYDLNADALYQQYKEQYQNLGQQAMMDTMGQAAALTGGYGNSYASTAGNQAYQTYLQGLNDKIPELAALARSNYDADTEALYNKANLINSMENQDYSRWNDEYSRWDSERQYLYNIYNNERDFDYTGYTNDRSLDYQLARDEVDDAQWQATFDENQRQFDLEYALSLAAQNAAAASSSSSYGSGSDYTGLRSTDPGADDDNETPTSDETPAPEKAPSSNYSSSDTNIVNDTIDKLKKMMKVGVSESAVDSFLRRQADKTNLTPEDAAKIKAKYERGEI